MLGYRNRPIICEYKGMPNCRNLVYQARSVYCDQCKKLSNKELKRKWRINNRDKVRLSNRKSWKKVGYEKRKKRFELYPELVKKKDIYMKEWVIKHSKQCLLCSASINYTSIHCRSCSNKINPKGFIKNHYKKIK